MRKLLVNRGSVDKDVYNSTINRVVYNTSYVGIPCSSRMPHFKTAKKMSYSTAQTPISSQYGVVILPHH